MSGIPPDEKIIFEHERKAIITDKAVYKKGIFSSLERYDFNDIVCMLSASSYESETRYNYLTHEEYYTGNRIVHVTVDMILSNGSVVNFLTYSRKYGETSEIEEAISEALADKVPFYTDVFNLPMTIHMIRKIIKEHHSLEETREKVDKMMNAPPPEIVERAINIISTLIGAAVAASAPVVLFMILADLVRVRSASLLIDSIWFIYLFSFLTFYILLKRSDEERFGKIIKTSLYSVLIPSVLSFITYIIFVLANPKILSEPITASTTVDLSWLTFYILYLMWLLLRRSKTSQ
jgi:hypothetical protein